MPNVFFRAASLLALASTAQAQATQTQAEAACLTRGEVRGMVAYFLPSVLQSTIERCTQRLGPGSYLLDRAPRLVSVLESGRSEAWPMAKQAFVKLGGEGKKDAAALFDALPEEALRPIVEAAVNQKLTNSIKPESCGDIDRVMAPLEPLPAANLVDVLSEAVMLAGRKDKNMRVCPDA